MKLWVLIQLTLGTKSKEKNQFSEDRLSYDFLARGISTVVEPQTSIDSRDPW
jgi:hypothetical protein